jgi:hypothetical protein
VFTTYVRRVSYIFTCKPNKNTIVFFITTGLMWDSVFDDHCVLRSVLYTVRRGDQTEPFGPEGVVAPCGLKQCSLGLNTG